MNYAIFKPSHGARTALSAQPQAAGARGQGSVRWLAMLAALLALAGTALATQTSLDTIANANYVGYILDSETTTGHSNIQAHATYRIDNPTGVTVTRTNVLRFRLINANTLAA